ncbi:MAG: hypothetical protein MHPSP_004635, partial [Paramarteilia canceri]
NNSNRRDNLLDKYGAERIKSSMKVIIFKQICAKLRFDTRASENKKDPIDQEEIIFEKFITNCKIHYTSSDIIIIDKQLATFHNWCKFIMYIRVYLVSNVQKFGPYVMPKTQLAL